MPPKGNRANLRTTRDMTEEERKEFARIGGKASQEKRRQAKTFKEALDWILDQELKPSTASERALMKRFPDLTYREAIAINMALRAKSKVAKDAVKAAQFTRDTTGELPAQMVNLHQEKPFEIKITTLEPEEEE